MLNKIVIMGRITKNPELRYTQSQKPVASFTIACERDYATKGQKRETDFIDCVAWNGTAEFVSKYFTKGQLAAVVGRLQSRDWTDKDGNKRRAWEVVCDNVYFAESKRERNGEDNTAGVDDGPSAFSDLGDVDGETPF